MLQAQWAARTRTRLTTLRFIKSIRGDAQIHARRPYSTPRKSRPPDKIDYNSKPEFSYTSLDSSSEEHVNYKLVTANDLESSKDPPKRVRMLIRDFIEDSLYNPHYGYFPRQANIFSSSDDMLDFSKIRDSNEFQEIVAQRYMGYGADAEGPGKQIFHTPTELFRVSLLNAIVKKLF